MPDSAPPRDDSHAASYDTFDDYLRLAIKEYYDRSWSTRRANFVALLLASGQVAAMAKGAVTGDRGLKGLAAGAIGVVALRLALRWAIGGPLGILVTAATAASLIAFFVQHQREISGKLGRFRERIAEERTRFEELQTGYRANRFDARERNLMVDGQLKRLLSDLDTL